jgi:hypothetical protein
MKRIETFIDGMPPGQLFLTQDCLSFGKRGAVDQALSWLVKTKVIVRAAYGVFYKPDPTVEKPSPMEIVKIKAAAFGRKVAIHAREAAVKLGLLDEHSKEYVYATTGRSSSFVLSESGQRIHLLGTSKRKTDLAETSVGTAILALWHLGPDSFSEENLTRSIARLDWKGRREFRDSIAKMPAWLSNLVLGMKAPDRPPAGSILAH